ncbi:protein translocase subunit SecD [Candidatus Gottesmanbacteria bacterium]|nr:protein translocase subunit SecD [Candidatus Gottesmanbacteria bacterium]
MKYFGFRLWFIAILFVLSAIVSLPKELRMQFTLGPLTFDRTISGPALNVSVGPLQIRNDLNGRYGLDLSGGTHLVLEADLSGISSTDQEKAFDSARDVVERRINLYGLTESVVQKANIGSSKRIIVEMPGIDDANQAIELVGRTAQLTFFEEGTKSAQIATPSSAKSIWSSPTGLSGKHLKRSEVTFDQNTGKPEVSLEFDSEGATLFEEITKRSVGKTLAIFLDEELLSAPQVNTAISGGRAVIQGSFSADEAKQLSIALNAGALPVPLKVIEQRNVGATLGVSSVTKSLFAGMIGLFIVGTFMIIQYGLLGLIADIALILYTLTVFALFKMIPVTLTLAGITGFILSIGMAVDANILIFERIKEELRWGKDYQTALRLGFDRAFPSIRDSNASSLITCAILYWFGTGVVRGFAVTLAIGILVSLFSAITVTRTLLRLLYR